MENKAIVLYSSQPYKKYRWIGYISSIQVGFVFLNILVTPSQKLIAERRSALTNGSGEKGDDSDGSSSSSLNETSNGTGSSSNTIWQRFKKLDYSELISLQNIGENIRDRPYVSLGMFGAAAIISGAFNIYVRRVAHVITLLPNQRIRFESFSAFALRKPPSIEVPARDVSCVVGRKSKTNYSILKFRGFLGYHLVHKTDGTFLQPRLYDEHLGYARSWHKK